MDSIVRIETSKRSVDFTMPWQTQPYTRNKSVGTGFFYMHNNIHYIITCAHVVESAYDIKIVYDKLDVQANLLAVCPSLDIAILQLTEDITPHNIFQSVIDLDDIHVNTSVIAIGFPMGNEQKITSNGIISGSHQYFIQTTAAINPGNSGGPLIDKHKKVIYGINSSKAVSGFFSTIDNIGYCIPMKLVDICLKLLTNTDNNTYPIKIEYNVLSAFEIMRSTPDVLSCYCNYNNDGAIVIHNCHQQLKDIITNGDVITKINDFDIYGKHLRINKVWLGERIDIETYLILFCVYQPTMIQFWSKDKQQLQTINIDMLDTYNTIIPNLFFFDKLDNLEYIIFSGLVIIPLIENLEKYFDADLWNLLTQNEKEVTSKIIISSIFAGSYVDNCKVLEPWTIISKVNNFNVNTLQDFKLHINKHNNGCIELETIPYAKIIIPVATWKEDDIHFNKLFNYPIDKTLEHTIDNNNISFLNYNNHENTIKIKL